MAWLEERDLPHAALLWARASDLPNGEPVHAAPVAVRCRWNDAPKLVLDKQGNTVALDATVVVRRDVPIGSLMRRGLLSAWLGSGSAADDNLLYEVKLFNETSDVKGRFKLRTVGLMRFKQKPNQV